VNTAVVFYSRRLLVEESWREGGYLDWSLVADQTGLAGLVVPCSTLENRNRADRAIGRVGSGNVRAVGRPRAAAEICGERRRHKGGGNGVFKNKVVDLVLLCRVWWWRVESVDFDGSVVACGCKVLVRWVEGDALDMTLVVRQRLELFEGVPRPDHHLGIQPHRDQD
jgi:hypothetical protein